MLLLKRLLIVLMFAFPLYACDTDEGPMEENLGEAGENIDERIIGVHHIACAGVHNTFRLACRT